MSKPATQSNKRGILFSVAQFFVQGLGIGRFRWMPGTWGSLLGITLVYILSIFEIRYSTFEVLTALLCVFSWMMIAIYEKYTQEHDDQKVVLDEVAGIFVSFLGMPLTWQTLFVGFLCFRIMDILKPFPISWVDEKIPGAFGTLLDDLAAGAVTCGLLHGLNWSGWL